MTGGRREGARRLVLGGLAACALAGALIPSWASSAEPDAKAGAALDRAVRFLQETQNPDGGFAARAGGASDPNLSAWATSALAAAGINPLDQSRPGGVDAFSYLTRHTSGLTETTDFDRVALVALAAGASPRSFGSVDPIGSILARRLPDGSFAQFQDGERGWVNATAWSIFPLSAVEDPGTEEAVDEAADWLIAQQRQDGAWSWGSDPDGAPPDADTTAAVIQALRAAGVDDSEAERRAFDFLRTMQGPDGGFRAQSGSPTNSATTAWAVQAMWAADEDPRDWKADGDGDPLSFLASLQRADGSIGWTADSDANSVWMTAQVGPALAGQSWPLPEAPRRLVLDDPPPEPGQGEGTQSGEGVIAGGGGEGAPIFSRPKQQSRGRTPGGTRVVRSAELRPRDRSRTRRGENTAQPQGVKRAKPRGGEGTAARPRAGRESGGHSGPDASPRPPAAEGVSAAGEGGERVTGYLVGESGDVLPGSLAFGAPGPHGAGERDPGHWLTLAVGAAALLMGLGGAVWERRHEGVRL